MLSTLYDKVFTVFFHGVMKSCMQMKQTIGGVGIGKLVHRQLAVRKSLKW